MSAALTIDRTKYLRLANRVVVKAIETEDEYDAMVAEVRRLMDKGEKHLTAEELALLETISILIEAYDDQHYPLAEAAPNATLAHLMESSGRKAKDLLSVFGTRGRVSEVLRGKRSISKEQAKKLGGALPSRSGAFYLGPDLLPGAGQLRPHPIPVGDRAFQFPAVFGHVHFTLGADQEEGMLAVLVLEVAVPVHHLLVGPILAVLLHLLVRHAVEVGAQVDAGFVLGLRVGLLLEVPDREVGFVAHRGNPS